MQRNNLDCRSWQRVSDGYGSLIQIEGLAYFKPIGTASSETWIIFAWSKRNG